MVQDIGRSVMTRIDLMMSEANARHTCVDAYIPSPHTPCQTMFVSDKRLKASHDQIPCTLRTVSNSSGKLPPRSCPPSCVRDQCPHSRPSKRGRLGGTHDGRARVHRTQKQHFGNCKIKDAKLVSIVLYRGKHSNLCSSSYFPYDAFCFYVL